MTPRAERVLVLSLVFPPDTVSTAQLFGELVEDLIRQGRSVTVLTTKPHYHPNDAGKLRSGLRPVWGGLLARSEFKGAVVYHTAMPLKGRGIAKRIFGWLGFHVLSVVAAVTLVRRTHVILAPSPPLTIGAVAWLLSRALRAPYIYNVQELYPDAAVSLGVLKDGIVLRLLRRLERFVYDGAFAVTAIAPGMRDKIIAKGVPPDRVRLVPNFVDMRDMIEQPKDNAFAREYDLHDKFVVMYAGNIGPYQGLSILLDAAELTRDRPDIRYVIVGEGVNRQALMESAQQRSLRNVQFVPQQPYARVPDIYGASDLNVVPLTRAMVADAVPSKVYRIMASQRPVLAIAESDSDLARIVREARAGWVVPPDDASSLANAVLGASRLRSGPLTSRDYVNSHVERSRITGVYGALLDEAMQLT